MASETKPNGPAPKFPIYLLPSFNIPFRRRTQSSFSNTSYCSSPPDETLVPSLGSSPTDSITHSPIESPQAPSYFPSHFSSTRGTPSVPVEALHISKLKQLHPDTIRCSTCSTDLAFTSQIVSKGFTGRFGRAYLVSPPARAKTGKSSADLINIRVGKSETRLLVTGSHVVADITCAICHAKIGWKYVDAKEEAQKYKVGKFILETARVMDHRSWEDVPISEMPDMQGETKDTAADGEEPIIFDSEDEDECEDIFSGTWDPQVAAGRRAKKVNRRPKQTV